jgi:hypothetical protein
MAMNYDAEQLVFVDETGVSHHTGTWMHGWSPCGEHVHRRDFFIHGVK